MAKETKDEGKPATPGADKAQAIKDAAAKASGTAGRTPEPAGAENRTSFDEADRIDREEREGEVKMNRPEVQGRRANAEEASKLNERFNKGKLSKAEQQEEQDNFVTGFNFDMYSLTELYANMRDGNYWSAFRLVVDILHANLNPAVRTPTNRNMPVRAAEPVRMSEVEDICMKLEECCEDLKREHSTQLKTSSRDEAPRASREKNVEAINFAGLIAMAEMLLTLLSKWKQSRGG